MEKRGGTRRTANAQRRMENKKKERQREREVTRQGDENESFFRTEVLSKERTINHKKVRTNSKIV